MEWFNGGVREAIAAAQTKKTVFVVVITGQISSKIKLDVLLLRFSDIFLLFITND